MTSSRSTLGDLIRGMRDPEEESATSAPAPEYNDAYDQDGYKLTIIGNPPATAIAQWPTGQMPMAFSEWEQTFTEQGGEIRRALEFIEASSSTAAPTPGPFNQDDPLHNQPMPPFAPPPAAAPGPAPVPTPPAPTPGPAPTTVPPAPTGSTPAQPGGGTPMTATTTPPGGPTPTPSDPLAGLAASAETERRARAHREAQLPLIVEGFVVETTRMGHDPATVAEALTRVVGAKAPDFPDRDANIQRVLDAKRAGDKRGEVIDAMARRNPSVPRDKVESFVDDAWDGVITPGDGGTTPGAPAPAAGTAEPMESELYRMVTQADGSLRIFEKAGNGWLDTHESFADSRELHRYFVAAKKQLNPAVERKLAGKPAELSSLESIRRVFKPSSRRQ